MTTYPFVQIIWHDAEDYRRSSWVDIEDAKAFAETSCEVISYGYLLAQNKGYVVIAADRIEEKPVSTTYGRVTKIPRPWIQSVKKIKPKKVR